MIDELISHSGKPGLYEKGTSFMWTDEHISKQLLNGHLDASIGPGSRKRSTIEKTSNWIFLIPLLSMPKIQLRTKT
jgi:hypothetical protein